MSPPVMSPPLVSRDEEHLRLLKIFHYVLAGIAGFFSLMPGIYILLGMVFMFVPPASKGDPMPEFVPWIFVGIGTSLMLLGFTFTALIFVSGRSISRRRRYIFCMVIAGLECLWMPFGTVLGVFSLIVMSRPSVKALFNAPSASHEGPEQQVIG